MIFRAKWATSFLSCFLFPIAIIPNSLYIAGKRLRRADFYSNSFSLSFNEFVLNYSCVNKPDEPLTFEIADKKRENIQRVLSKKRPSFIREVNVVHHHHLLLPSAFGRLPRLWWVFVSLACFRNHLSVSLGTISSIAPWNEPRANGPRRLAALGHKPSDGWMDAEKSLRHSFQELNY